VDRRGMPPRRSRAWSTDDAPRQTLYNAYNVSPLRQQGGSIEYMTGEDAEQLMSSICATPRDVIERARALVGGALNMAAWTGE
jgi:hypothetical protein